MHAASGRVGWGLGSTICHVSVLLLQVGPRSAPRARGTTGLRPISMPGMVGFCVSGDMNIKSMGSG